MKLEEASARVNAMIERRSLRALNYRATAAEMNRDREDGPVAIRHVREEIIARYERDATFAETDARALTLILFKLSELMGEKDGRTIHDERASDQAGGAAGGERLDGAA